MRAKEVTMDPQATLNDLLSAIGERDWDRVRELSDALLTWMERGGFPPDTVGARSLGVQWHRAVATFVCHAATSRANDAMKRRMRKGGA
jgi:hypothetical protein